MEREARRTEQEKVFGRVRGVGKSVFFSLSFFRSLSISSSISISTVSLSHLPPPPSPPAGHALWQCARLRAAAMIVSAEDLVADVEREKARRR